MSTIILSRDLTPADDGMHTWTMNATQNGVTVSAVFMVTIVSGTVQVVPVSITLSPNSASFPDNTAAGTLVTTPSIIMSDGSVFAGTFAATDETGAAAPVTFQP